MQETMYDPPTGWRYGFPKAYRPIEGEGLEHTLSRDGYPSDKADFAAKHCRFWLEEKKEHHDTAARAAVEGARWATASVRYTDDHPPIPGERNGDFMATYTGRKFWPLDPRADEVRIEDIAHALSMQCRYGGHSVRFYSVAEHSVHIYRWLAAGNYAPNVRLAGLLHDATEAYVADVPRPLKRHLAGYKDAEALVWRAVAERFGLMGYEDDLPAVVHEGDNRILGDEIARLMVPMDWHAKHDDPIGADIECWSPQRAEAEFLRAFYHCERLMEMAA